MCFKIFITYFPYYTITDTAVLGVLSLFSIDSILTTPYSRPHYSVNPVPIFLVISYQRDSSMHEKQNSINLSK